MRCNDGSDVRAIALSAATLWRCGQPRFQPATRLRPGGRANDKGKPVKYVQTDGERCAKAEHRGPKVMRFRQRA